MEGACGACGAPHEQTRHASGVRLLSPLEPLMASDSVDAPPGLSLAASAATEGPMASPTLLFASHRRPPQPGPFLGLLARALKST